MTIAELIIELKKLDQSAPLQIIVNSKRKSLFNLTIDESCIPANKEPGEPIFLEISL